MKNNYNEGVYNNFSKFIEEYFSNLWEKYGFNLEDIKVGYDRGIDLNYYIKMAETHEFLFKVYLRNRKDEVNEYEISVPRMINNVFVIEGKLKIAVNNLTMKRNSIRFENRGSIRQFIINCTKKEHLELYKMGNSFYFRIDKEVEIKKDEFLKKYSSIDDLDLSEEDKIRWRIKVGVDKDASFNDILVKTMERISEGADDIDDQNVIDKHILTPYEDLKRYLNKMKMPINRDISNQFKNHKNFYPRRFSNAVVKYFINANEDTSVISPTKVNIMNFQTLGNRLKIPDNYHRNIFAKEGVFDIIDMAKTPEGANVNIINELNKCSVIKSDGSIYISIYDTEFNPVEISLIVYYDSKVLDSSTVDFENKTLLEGFGTHKYKYRGKHTNFEEGEKAKDIFEQVDYIDAKADDKLSITTRKIPMVNHTDSVRISMGTAMIGQSLELEEPESPIISSGNNDASDNPLMVVYENGGGTVSSIDNGEVVITDEEGNNSIFDYYPMAGIHNVTLTRTPKVKVGDKVKKGDVIITPSSISEKSDNLGRNLLAAYFMYGETHEDGIVISESTSRKMSHISVQSFMYEIPENSSILGIDEKLIGSRVKSRDILIAYNKQRKNLRGKNGGTTIPGNYLVPNNIGDESYILDVKVSKGSIEGSDQEEQMINKLNSNRVRGMTELKNIFKDSLVVPIKNEPPVPSELKYIIEVKFIWRSKLKVGDKITNRYGSKGVIAEVLPDNDMPIISGTEEVVDVILNPSSTLARKNPSQLYEQGLSNVSKDIYSRIQSIEDKDEVRRILSKYIAREISNYDDEKLDKLIRSRSAKKYFTINVGSFSNNVQELLSDYGKEFDFKYISNLHYGDKHSDSDLAGMGIGPRRT